MPNGRPDNPSGSNRETQPRDYSVDGYVSSVHRNIFLFSEFNANRSVNEYHEPSKPQ